MPRRPSVQPTAVELEILNVLWEHGPCPLGEIHQQLTANGERAYSTTRKMVQVMRDKGLIVCDDSSRPQQYSAAEPKDQTQLSLLEDIVDRAFGGSSQNMLMSLLSAKRLTPDELTEMQRLVDEAKKQGKKK